MLLSFRSAEFRRSPISEGIYVLEGVFLCAFWRPPAFEFRSPIGAARARARPGSNPRGASTHPGKERVLTGWTKYTGCRPVHPGIAVSDVARLFGLRLFFFCARSMCPGFSRRVLWMNPGIECFAGAVDV